MKPDLPAPLRTGLSRSATRPVLVSLLACALVTAALWMLRPFIPSLIWAGTIAVTMWPLLMRMERRFHIGRKSAVTATLFIATGMFVLPFWLAIATVVKHAPALAGVMPWLSSLKLPDLPHRIATLPLVGNSLSEWWHRLQNMRPVDLALSAVPKPDQIMHYLLSYAGSIGMLAVQFILTLFFLAILLSRAEFLIRTAEKVTSLLSGPSGQSMLHLAVRTIRGVALGVTVTAIAESCVGGAGLYLTGVPGASIVTAVTFMLCLLQAGPGVTLFPAVIWVYFDRGLGEALLLLIITLITIVIDNMLRPYLIRKEADIPLSLIVMGGIGGLSALGLAGLFIGPMLLSVAYTLIGTWMKQEDTIIRECPSDQSSTPLS